MIDVLEIVKQPLIKDAIKTCSALVYGAKVRTTYQPQLLKELLSIATDCPEKPKNFKLEIERREMNNLLDTICLVSGGADSTIAWHLFGKPQGIYIDIGQNYSSKETSCLQKLNIPTLYVDINEKDLGATSTEWKHIIPGRNFLFLTIAAECLENHGKLIFSVVDGEGWESGKGDKSKDFVIAWQKWYKSLTGKTIGVSTCVERTKAGWLRAFINADNDINIIRHGTVTCFSEESGQCGKCQGCVRKYLSFVSNNINIKEDYNIHPMIGAKEYVDKYKVVLNKALKLNDYSHYSLARCTEDLAAIEKAEILVKLKVK
jgi:7-cyano-7-deazaguanine synthase in queuosine biosynthesis